MTRGEEAPTGRLLPARFQKPGKVFKDFFSSCDKSRGRCVNWMKGQNAKTDQTAQTCPISERKDSYEAFSRSHRRSAADRRSAGRGGRRHRPAYHRRPASRHHRPGGRREADPAGQKRRRGLPHHLRRHHLSAHPGPGQRHGPGGGVEQQDSDRQPTPRPTPSRRT